MAGRAPLRTAAAGIIVAILAALVLAADQFAKFLALTHLPLETPVHVLGNFLILFLIKNAGAAFSLGTGVTWVFTIALTLVAVGIVWLAATRIRSRAWAVVLGLLLGGVLGNLTDRLFRAPGFAVGHVVDFISTPWMMPAIYNVADMFIVTMMIGVAILVLIGLRMDGTRERRAAAAAGATGVTTEPDAAAESTADSDARPSEVEGFGDDRDPLFPAADAEAGTLHEPAGPDAPEGDLPPRG